MKAAQYPLLSEHHESGAGSPEAAHHVEGDDRPTKITYSARITAGEYSGIEKKHAERKDRTEEKKHFVAQGELNTRERQPGTMRQSRSLLPVISMKTSSREGEDISKLPRSLPPASR